MVKDATPDDPQDFAFTAGGGLSPTSFSLDDDADATLSNTQTFTNVVPGSGYSLARDRADRLGPDLGHLHDGSPVTNINVERRRDRHLHVHEPQARPDRRRRGRRAQRRRRTSPSRPAAASRPRASRSTTTPTRRCRTRARSPTSCPAPATRCPRPCPTGWDQTSRDLQTTAARSSNIDVGAGETVTCTFVEHEARPRSSVVKDARAERRAGLLLHGRRRPLAGELLARRRRRRDALEHADVHQRRARAAATRVAETVPSRLGPGERHLQRRQPGRRTSTLSAGETVTCTFTNNKRGQIVVVKDAQPERRAGLRLHGRRRPRRRRASRSTTTPTRRSRTRDVHQRRRRAAATRSPRPCRPAGTSRARPATTAARSRTSTSAPARPSPARSRTASAARSSSSRTRSPTTRRTSPSRPAAASARRASRSTTTPTRRSRTRARSRNVPPGSGYSVAETVPSGWDQIGATCDDGSPVSNIDVSAGRDRHLHVHEPQARADRGRQGRAAERPAGLRLHGRRRPQPVELLARRRRRRDALEHAHLHERRARLRLLARRDRAERLGPDLAPPATTAARSRTSTSRRARPSPARSRTASAARSWSSRTPLPNDPQDFSFTAGGGSRPASFSLDDDSDRTLSNTRRSPTSCPAAGYSLAETVPSGWDQTGGHLRRRQPGRRTSTSRAGRDRHLHVHEPQARADRRSSRTRLPNDPQDFSLHGRRRPLPGELLARRRLRPDALEHAARSPNVVPGGGYSRRRDRAERLGPDRARPATTAARSSNIDVAPGETVTCTFTNRKRGQIVVVKDATPERPAGLLASRPAAASRPRASRSTTTPTRRSRTRSTFTERRARAAATRSPRPCPAGWDQTARHLRRRQPGRRTSTSAPGETVTCTFTNRKRGPDRRRQGRAAQRPAGLRLHGRRRPHARRASRSTTTPTRRSPNTQHLRQRRPPGAATRSPRPCPAAGTRPRATCDDGSPVVEHRRRRRRDRHLHLHQPQARARSSSSRTRTPNDPQDFSFTAGGGLSARRASRSTTTPTDALEHAHVRATSCRAAATRSSETVPAGWDQTARHLRRRQPGRRTSTSPPGETVTCTFANRKRGQIVVVKDATPNDPQDFAFTAGGGLSPGELPARRRLRPDALEHAARSRTSCPAAGYSLAETVPSGWDQTSATCDDGSPVSNIDVARRRDGHLHLREPQARHDRRGQGRAPERPAGLRLHGRRRALRPRASRSTTTPTRRSPNTQHVHERRCPAAATRSPRPCPAGWDQTSATCDDGSPVVERSTLAPGETVTCTFTNRKRGQIVVVKDAHAQRPAGLLASRPAAASRPSSFSLDDDSDATLSNTRTFANVAPGTGYSVAETVPAGWDQTGATCDDGSPRLEHRRRAGRDRHLHVHEPQARPDRRRRGRAAERPAGLLLHGRRRPLARRASRSTTTPTATLSNTRTFANVAPGQRLLARRDRAGRLGPDRRRPATTAARVSNIDVARRRDRHLHVHEPQARPDRRRQGRAAERPAGLLLHRRRRPHARELPARRRLRRRRSRTRARSTTSSPGAGYSLAETVPSGWDQTRATCDDGSPVVEHRRRPPARPSPARSRTASAARSSSSRTRSRTTRRTSPSPPAAACRPRASRSTTTPTRRSRTRARSATSLPGAGYSVVRDRAGRLGPDERHLRRRQPGLEHRRRRRRDGHLHVHEPQARPDRRRQGRAAERPAGLRLHRRRRPVARRASRSTTTPTRRSRTRARSPNVAPGQRLLGRPRPCPRGWDLTSRDLRRRQPGRRTSTSRRARSSPARSRTASAARSWSSRTRSRTTRRTSRFTAGGGLSPVELPARRRLRPRRSRTRAPSPTSRPAPATRSPRRVPAGWDQTSATCDDGSPRLEHRRRRRARPSPAPSRTASAARSSSSRTRSPNDPQDFCFTAGGGLSPVELPARRRLRRDALQHAHVHERRRRAPATRSPRRVPSGWDQTERHLRRRQPGRRTSTSRAGETVTCTFTNRKRGKIVVVKDAQPERRAGLHLHRRRRPRPSSFQLDDDSDATLSNTRTFTDVVPGSRLLGRRDAARRLVPDRRHLQRRQPGRRTSTCAAGETVTCTFVNMRGYPRPKGRRRSTSRWCSPTTPVRSPNRSARAAARVPRPATRRSELQLPDRRHAGRERQGGELGRQRRCSKAIIGNADTPADEADVSIDVHVTDVRRERRPDTTTRASSGSSCRCGSPTAATGRPGPRSARCRTLSIAVASAVRGDRPAPASRRHLRRRHDRRRGDAGSRGREEAHDLGAGRGRGARRRRRRPGLDDRDNTVFARQGVFVPVIRRARSRSSPAVERRWYEVSEVSADAAAARRLAGAGARRAGARRAARDLRARRARLGDRRSRAGGRGRAACTTARPLRRVPARRRSGRGWPPHHPEARAGGPRSASTALRAPCALPPDFELEVRAVLESGRRAPMALLRGTREPLPHGLRAALQPLMVTTLGRTGSMVLMRMLEAHPEVLVYRPHRYEQRVAGYWLDVLLTLSDPSSYMRQIAPAGNLEDPLWWLGPEPPPPRLRDSDLQRWLGSEALRAARARQPRSGSRRSTTRSPRRRTSRRRGCFAEKHSLRTAALGAELYPRRREVFLVRDFRDMVTSIMAFNRRAASRDSAAPAPQRRGLGRRAWPAGRPAWCAPGSGAPGPRPSGPLRGPRPKPGRDARRAARARRRRLLAGARRADAGGARHRDAGARRPPHPAARAESDRPLASAT